MPLTARHCLNAKFDYLTNFTFIIRKKLLSKNATHVTFFAQFEYDVRQLALVTSRAESFCR